MEGSPPHKKRKIDGLISTLWDLFWKERSRKINKVIVQCNTKLEAIRIFSTIVDAAKFTNLSIERLEAAIRDQELEDGYYWQIL